jgi:hypothetical protein
MSTTNMIIGLALGVLLGALIIAFRHRFRDVFAALLVLGVIVLAVAVTIWRVDQYRDEKATAAPPMAESQVLPLGAGGPAGPPPKPPVALPPSSMGRGATGSAAPAAVENPYAGGAK